MSLFYKIIFMSKPSATPKIDLLLPFKESFSAANAGAVSTIVRDLISEGTKSGTQTVFGKKIEHPFPGINFISLNTRHKWLHGKNIGFAAAYYDHLKYNPLPDLIEVHGRCNVAAYLLKKKLTIPISLFVYNDPREMEGAKSPKERQTLLHGLVQIVCVSNFIGDCFLDGLSPAKCDLKKIQNLNCGVTRRLTSPPAKEPIIFIAGRMVPEKGILEAALAIVNILPLYPEWKLVIAGARRFEDAPAGSYEAKVGKAIAPLGSQAEMLGFIPPDAVRLWQERAAIAVCPSIWQEPLGKVVVEALAEGCAVLTTRCGGIPEVAEGRALIIDNPTVSAFSEGFDALLSDETLRCDLQMKAWNDFPFTSAAMANKVDILRKSVITSLPGHRV
tara:strand:+ start:944 stop:2107 length:1164 start_codon:yes stop_codon:yes gene_type:complete